MISLKIIHRQLLLGTATQKADAAAHTLQRSVCKEVPIITASPERYRGVSASFFINHLFEEKREREKEKETGVQQIVSRPAVYQPLC